MSTRPRNCWPRPALPDGFTVTMDTRNTPEITAMAEAIQQTMALAGIEMEMIPGDGQQTLTKYRARNHDIYIGRWGPDYQDPHTNADTFARNPDNSDDAAVQAAGLAQRLGHPGDDRRGRCGRAGSGCRQARRRCTWSCRQSISRSRPS